VLDRLIGIGQRVRWRHGLVVGGGRRRGQQCNKQKRIDVARLGPHGFLPYVFWFCWVWFCWHPVGPSGVSRNLRPRVRLFGGRRNQRVAMKPPAMAASRPLCSSPLCGSMARVFGTRSMQNKFRGVMQSPITPLKDDYSLDLPTFEKVL